LNVSQVFVNLLQRFGVTRVYGLIGTSILDFVDALKDTNIRYISTRQDQSAVSMAVAEGKILDHPGVAVVHGGPGFLNSLTAIAIASKDCVPAVVITGAVKRRMRGLDSWLEVDQEALSRPLAKSFLRIDKGTEAPLLISRAFSISSSAPKGPVVVECAEDAWRLEVPYFAINKSETSLKAEEKLTANDIEVRRVLEILKKSKAPVIVAGGGINNEKGVALLERFVGKFRIPVVTTGNGRGAISEDHEFSLGRIGFGGGSTLADFCLKESDFVLAIGAGLSDVSTYGYNYIPHGEIIRVNLDHLGEKKPIPYTMSLNCDAVSFIEKLLELAYMTTYEYPKEWIVKIQQEREKWASLLEEAVSRKYDGFVNPSRFFAKLSTRLPVDTIISAGQGLHILYTHTFLEIRKHSSFLAATNLGAMGYALPAALAAKAACPEREVVAVLGDGEFMMSISELETAKREKLGVKIIVVNDNSYRVLLLRQQLQKMGRIHGTLLSNPDFINLGKAFGVATMSLEDDKKIAEALEFAIEKSEEPRLLELKISREDLPPLNVEASLRF
jgi:acetolactate synthase-1/2/3 large subunit